MVIGLDASFVHGEKSGTAMYIDRLVKGLSHVDEENKYIIFPFYTYIFSPLQRHYFPPVGNNFTVFGKNIPNRVLQFVWNKYPKLRRLLLPKVDVFHSMTFSIPPAGTYKKLVMTIYDTTFYTHPQHHIKENIDHCMKGTQFAVDHADAIIAISEKTKSDLIHYFNCPPEKIHVTYLGADHLSVNNRKDRAHKIILRDYGIHKKYIFHLGSIEPRKNTLGLIKAYSLLPEDIRNKYLLVIGGAQGWKNSTLLRFINQHSLRKNILFVGYIPASDLPSLYSNASLFVYPSFYEGFGIPPLEAMISGCPTLVANSGSLPEVCGPHVGYCNPYSIEDISRQMVKAFDTSSQDIDAARDFARNYQWNKTALATKEIYLGL